MKMGLEGYAEDIQKMGETAGKEYQIEVAIDDMEEAWKDIELDLLPYKTTGTHGIDRLRLPNQRRKNKAHSLKFYHHQLFRVQMRQLHPYRNR